jgi:hypothetical protein
MTGSLHCSRARVAHGHARRLFYHAFPLLHQRGTPGLGPCNHASLGGKGSHHRGRPHQGNLRDIGRQNRDVSRRDQPAAGGQAPVSLTGTHPETRMDAGVRASRAAAARPCRPPRAGRIQGRWRPVPERAEGASPSAAVRLVTAGANRAPPPRLTRPASAQRTGRGEHGRTRPAGRAEGAGEEAARAAGPRGALRRPLNDPRPRGDQ